MAVVNVPPEAPSKRTAGPETDNHGTTALMVAVNHGYLEIVRLLIKKGADVNAGKFEGTTALMIAASWDYTEIARLLLKKHAILAWRPFRARSS